MVAAVIGARRRKDNMHLANRLPYRTSLFAVLATSLFQAASAASVTRVYGFTGGKDGGLALSPVLKSGSTLYTATSGGGRLGAGTVDKVLIGNDRESVLHSFGAAKDAANPQGNLVEIGGILYGTTVNGGVNGAGTLYSVNPKTRIETVLHSFGAGTDAFYPMAGVINVSGVLYGTSFYGGTGTGCDHPGCGTVFSFDPSNGAYGIIYSFQGGSDGAFPKAGLLSVGGSLYGTTGGNGNGGAGNIFHIDPATGAETVDYRFSGGSDAETPQAELINVGGILYGTSANGGSQEPACMPSGCGTVFAFDPATGAETVLYRFQGDGKDGANPAAALVFWRGKFWGTTESGGSSDFGTIFSLDPATGKEKVEADNSSGLGLSPQTPLLNAGSVLYGTATDEIFKVTP
jgi:uncharacterized repeat protein (TIGR03803 family)